MIAGEFILPVWNFNSVWIRNSLDCRSLGVSDNQGIRWLLPWYAL